LATRALFSTTDRNALAARLEADISGEVRFDDGSRALYTTDASLYRQVPIGVVIPYIVDDVRATLRAAADFGAPVLMRGAGTSLAGQTCNVAVVIDTSKYLNRILEIDPNSCRAWVEPGVICNTLRTAAQRFGLTFGPDPSTHTRATLGGMVGNNSCGAHSVMAGKTAENVVALEILTVEGHRLRVGEDCVEAVEPNDHDAVAVATRIKHELGTLAERAAESVRHDFPSIRRRVSGFNLDYLLPENRFQVARALVGSEGTCAVVVAVQVRLVPSPAHRVLLVAGYPDIFTAGDRAPTLVAAGALAVEGIDHNIIRDMRRKQMAPPALDELPSGDGFLLVEFGGATQAEAEQAACHAAKGEADFAYTRIFTDSAKAAELWAVRANGAAATNAVPGEPETYAGWEDAAVDPGQVGDYLRDFKALLDRYGYHSSLYGHLGDGCIHGRITFDLKSNEGVTIWRRFMIEAADLVVAYGGSLSGEHGDGQTRAELLPRMFGPAIMRAFGEFKSIWDPDNRLNPGKVVDPYPLDSNLKVGPDTHLAEPATRFAFAADQGSFASAAGRCVGSGKCRRPNGGAMCPSYQATGEEAWSTRGRARLLEEMLRGEVIHGGWENEAVKASLDLCLACKSCRSECPVQVDMATYKAEFLSHYYENHWRPRQALSMGRIHRWARLAGKAPKLANAVSGAPGFEHIVRRIGGIAKDRALPHFQEPFQKRFARRRSRAARSAPPVMLWPDTFNNHFHPETAMAAVDALEMLGYRVEVPRGFVCCGRPLYDFGMLDAAKQRLSETLNTLAQTLEVGTPIVGLEPSCMVTFRDELPNLFPQRADAAALARNTYLLSEFVSHDVLNDVPELGDRALVHGHCHQKAVAGMKPAERLFDALGLDWSSPESGCCGMAGSFGFDPAKIHISLTLAEKRLAPAIRAADTATRIVADGYSCREQIIQTTGRRAAHSVELLAEALGNRDR